MRRFLIAALLTVLALPSFAADAKPEEKPLTEDQKTVYALGLFVAQQISSFDLSPAEKDLMIRGLDDALSGRKTLVDLETYNSKMQSLRAARMKGRGEKLAAAAKEFTEKAEKEKGAVKTPSGLIYIPVTEGTGPAPKATDTVKVHYRGTLVDGKEFDSSYRRGQPADFPLNGVISCWTEGLQKMKQGGKAKLICPPATAYGERGAGTAIPPNATLQFEVELLEVQKK